jgi:hypothetical protein
MKADAEALKAEAKGKTVEELFETAEFKRLAGLNGKFKCGPSRPPALPHTAALPPP